MKNIIRNMARWGIIISFIFMVGTMIFQGISLSMQLKYYENNNDENTQEVLKSFANNFEEEIKNYTQEDERLIKEGRFIVNLGYGIQCIAISNFLLVATVGIVVGAGVGYIKSVEKISKSHVKKMIVMYVIGVILLELIYFLNSLTNDGMVSEVQYIFEESLPIVLIFTIVYVIVIIGKIIKNNKNKNDLNTLLKQNEEKK